MKDGFKRLFLQLINVLFRNNNNTIQQQKSKHLYLKRQENQF